MTNPVTDALADPGSLAAQVLAECVHDPLRFVMSMYPWGVPGTPLESHAGPRPWQRELLEAIGEHLQSPATRFTPFRDSVASGHGIGKSAMMAWLSQWGITTMLDARGRITANTEAQLRTITWPEMRKWYGLLAVREFFRVDGTVFRARDKDHELTWRLDATPWSEHRPDAFHGLHNQGRRILVLFDEASGIADIIWEVIEGALTDENTEILWLAFGNPTNPKGRFYQTHTTHRHRWRHQQIDSRTVDGTNKQQFEEWIQDYGIDSDFVRVRVLGQFPRSGSNQLIPTESVLAAQKRDVSPRITDPLIFGLDVARFGDDQSVLMTRKGCAAGAHGVFKWRGLDNVELAREVKRIWKELHPHYCFIDGGGPGGGVVDILRHDGYDVREIHFGGKPQNPDFANKRAEMWWDMRTWLTDVGCIPWNDSDLFAELTNQTYHYRENANNDLILTPKDVMKREGLPSPDTADALALTFAEAVAPVNQISQVLGNAGESRDREYVGGWE